MELLHTDIKPDRARKPFFDSDDLDSASYEINCTECNAVISASCRSIYRGAWRKDWPFNNEQEIAIKYFYGIDDKNISLTRGWLSFTKHVCESCDINYILVADFLEYRNSVYQIVVQGVARVKT